jgi:hypothetical protein
MTDKVTQVLPMRVTLKYSFTTLHNLILFLFLNFKALYLVAFYSKNFIFTYLGFVFTLSINVSDNNLYFVAVSCAFHSMLSNIDM